jgi:hypothetical protein
MGARNAITPAEMVRRMPEDPDGTGAGPGAPETVEPVQGRPGPRGHGPTGPGGSTIGRTLVAAPRADGRTAQGDAIPGAAGAAAFALHGTIVGAGRLLRRLFGRDPG